MTRTNWNKPWTIKCKLCPEKILFKRTKVGSAKDHIYFTHSDDGLLVDNIPICNKCFKKIFDDVVQTKDLNTNTTTR